MIRFGDFEVDADAGVLRKHGVRVKLQDLPFRLLVVLLRRPGAVISREALRAELWGAETFVDAEAGLNTAIAKVREALGDSADAPRLIETLPKRGYRFTGTILEAPVPVAVPRADPQPPPMRRSWLLALAAIIVGALVLSAYRLSPPTRPLSRTTIAVVRFHNETGAADLDRLAESLTDAVVVALAENTRYAVIGNSPVLRTERIFEDVGRIGHALAAEYVVLGQLQNGDRGLVARGHFIRVSDGTHLWADRIDLGVPDRERAMTTSVTRGVGIGLTRAATYPRRPAS